MSANYADAVDLFDRVYKLQVDTIVISELHVEFEVKRSLSAKVPNSAEIKVFNLSAESRKKLQAQHNVFVSLEAGYAMGSSLIFRGDLREAWSSREGTDWVTTISSGDAEVARETARINKSFPAGTSYSAIIVACAQALRVGMGNTSKVAASAQLWNVTPAQCHTGYVAAGDALSQLDRVCRSCGLEWSIQDNQLQLLPRGRPLEQQGILLSANTGMVGSPELGKGGVVRVRTLMIPGVYPGRRVQLETDHVSGVYRVETAGCKGQLEGDDWGYELELKEPNAPLVLTTTKAASPTP